MNSLRIVICKDVQDAIDKGFDYAHRSEAERPTHVTLDAAVVVRKGMASGRSSVDLILHDADGKEYVALVPSALLENIPSFDD